MGYLEHELVVRTGKICYLEIPAIDVDRSAKFYIEVFGWQTRLRGDGALAFDDTVGVVSGSWVTGRAPATEPGLAVYVMVASAADATKAVLRAGGEIVRPVNPEDHEVYFWFRDPAGNVLGAYQEPGLAGDEARLPH